MLVISSAEYDQLRGDESSMIEMRRLRLANYPDLKPAMAPNPSVMSAPPNFLMSNGVQAGKKRSHAHCHFADTADCTRGAGALLSYSGGMGDSSMH